jgi:excisionase family DNA binding protein
MKKQTTTEGLLPPLLSIQQVAEATGFHPKTIRRRVEDSTLPAVRFGPRCIRIRREDVLKLMTPLVTPLGADDASQAD